MRLPSPLARRLILVGGAGLITAGLVLTLVLVDPHQDPGTAGGLLSVFAVLSFVGIGLFAWARRPASRFGALMVAVAAVFALGTPTQSHVPWLFSLGYLFSGLFLATVIHMVLAFPSGRLETRAAGRVVGLVYALVLGVNAVILLVDGDPDFGEASPADVLALAHARSVGTAVFDVGLSIGLGVCIVVLAQAGGRWRRASRPQRRVVGPMLLTGVLFVVLLAGGFITNLAGADPDQLDNGTLLAFGVLPYAFLLSLARARWFRAGAVGRLVERLNAPGGTRDALATALGDATLDVAFWLPRDERWADAAGRPVTLPGPSSGRAWTEVVRDGRRIGAMVHDEALGDDKELLRAAGYAAALALENERLQAELRARVEELEGSRAKVIEASLAERRRLERDLHDGAQQRLVALGLKVGLAQVKVAEDPARAEAILGEARDELRQAQAELRELARGIHPAILTDRGLDAALDSLARRSPVDVELAPMPGERLPAPVEAAAYFVVAESLTNVAKYAEATRARVSVTRVDGHAVVEVADDGRGGADPTRGSGLRGLADRVAALDGRFEVGAGAEAGTLVRAEIPVGP